MSNIDGSFERGTKMSEFTAKKFSPCRLIGLIGVIFIIVGAIAVGAGWQIFINPVSLMFALGITFFLLLATFGKDFLKFIPDCLIMLVSTCENPNPRLAEIAAFGSRYVVGAGVIGALIGLIQMLSNLSSPESIGVGMATALIVPFYAIVVSEIFFAYLYKAYSDGSKTEKNESLSLRNIALPSIVVALMLIAFFALLIAFSS